METDLITTGQENTNNEEIPETIPETTPETLPEETPGEPSGDIFIPSDTEDIQQGESPLLSDTEDLQENPESDSVESLEDGDQSEILDSDTVSGSDVRTDEEFISALSDSQNDYTQILNSIEYHLSTLQQIEEKQNASLFDKQFKDYTVTDGQLFLLFIIAVIATAWTIFNRKE